MTTPTFTSKAYECSKSNATVSSGTNSWINEFSDPIELEPGDQVRILGSFVNEASTGDSMEIVDGQNSMNINFMPYIKGTTFATSVNDQDLLTLGQIATPAYSTDSFGIEPPMSQKFDEFNPDGIVPAPVAPATQKFSSYYAKYKAAAAPLIGGTYDLGLQEEGETPLPVALQYDNYGLYNDPDITATQAGQNINGNTIGSWHSQGQQSETWGSNLITGNYGDKFNDYKNFADVSIPNDFLISSMCKKLILPVLTTFRTLDYPGLTNLDFTFDPLVYTPPAAKTSVNNTLSGVPKPGYMMCTVDIGQSSGWYDNTGKGYYETGHQTGMVNLKSGPQSVIGKVLSVRPIKHQTTDTISTTGKSRVEIDCFEVFVYDCFNPAQINSMISYNAPLNTLVEAKNPQRTVLSTAQTVVRAVHGAPEYKLGYSPNPSYNHINGMFGQVVPTGGSCAGIPLANNYSNETDNTNTIPVPGYPINPKFTTPGVGQPKYQVGADLTANELSEYDYGYGKPMGLSYLWSGSHTGILHYELPTEGLGVAGPDSHYVPNNWNMRENTLSYIGKIGGDTAWEFKVHNMKYVYDGTPVPVPIGPSPVADDTSNFNLGCGALICCPPEEMEQITKGYYASNEIKPYGQAITTTCSGTEGGLTMNVDDITGLNTNFYMNIGEAGNTVVRNITLVVPGAGLTGTITMDGVNEVSFAVTTVTFNNPTGYLPRVWLPWSYQLNESNYNERHFKNNSYATDATTTNAQALDENAVAGLPKNGMTVQEENRFDIGFVGQPTNWNWRSPYLPDKDTFKQSTGFTSNGITVAPRTGDPADPVTNYDYGTASYDRCPRYYSTPDGRQITGDPLVNAFTGAPYMWGGYQNANSSIHFQQPQTGDTKLGLTHTTPGILGIAVSSPIPPEVIVSGVASQDITGWYLQADFVIESGITVASWADGGGGLYGLQFNDRAGNPINLAGLASIGSKMFFTITPPGDCGAGVNAKEWAADHLMIKEYNMKIEVPKGFYTNEHIATEINKVLHRSTIDYAANDGTYNATKNVYEVPTTVGIRERTPASEASLVNANFIQSYIPDLSYGIVPVTSDNATKLGQTASTKELSIKTYDSYDVNTQTWSYYYDWDLDSNLTGVNVKTVANTPCGKHCKFYSVPYLDKTSHAAGQSVELHLFKLKGGALNFQDFDTSHSVDKWNNLLSRTQMLENIKHAQYVLGPTEEWETTGTANDMCFFWNSRMNRNLMSHGGGAKIFAGANNATFQFNEAEDRLQFTNLYTPYRPHESSNTNKGDFDIGDAIPAAIINARKSGAIISSITGLYITNLNADAINEINYGTDYFNNILYDVDSDAVVQTRGTTFLGQLGFSIEQVATFANSLDLVSTPFTFVNRLQFFGNTLTTRAKIDTAINASNPSVSNCTEVAPVRQFYAEVESETVSAAEPSTRGTNPFYLIGSDFPGSQFYGSTEGQHLPVIGICSRNYSAFNFVFDLGGSSISFTIDQKVSLKSIKTEIYTARLGTPQNLNDYSSVIYLVTKAKYVNQITQPELIQQVAQLVEQNAQQRMVGSFYNPAEASYRTGIPPELTPQQTKEYYESDGSYYPSDTETEDFIDSSDD